MSETVRLLIVEDGKENRDAARAYFNSRPDVSVYFSTNYEDGLKEVRKDVYDAGLFDMQLPHKKGSDSRDLGLDLAKEASNHGMAWAIITAGGFHGQLGVGTSAIIEPLTKSDTLCPEPKNDQTPWKMTYERITPVIEAKRRYRKFVGRPFVYEHKEIAQSVEK